MVFNNGQVPWNRGIPCTEKTKKKLSDCNKGKHPTEETRRKISLAGMGRTLSEKHKQLLSERMRGNKLCVGRILSKEALKNRSETIKGRKHTNESKLKMSISKKGKIYWNKDYHLSKQHKQKISDAHKGKPKSEETKLKLSIAHRGKVLTEEHKKNISKSQKGKIVSEETIKKISGENASNWKGGISFEPYCQKFNKQLKEHIRERDSRTCQLCGEKENGKKLDVHHIHYDKPNCTPDLVSLCKSCNAKVNFNREYWELYFIGLLTKRGLLV